MVWDKSEIFTVGFPIENDPNPGKSNRFPPVEFHERVAIILLISIVVVIPIATLLLILHSSLLSLSEIIPTTSWAVRTDSNRPAASLTSLGAQTVPLGNCLELKFSKRSRFGWKFTRGRLRNYSRVSYRK